jgi:hypothetical protein
VSIDFVDLGASRLDADSGAVLVQAKSAPTGDDEAEAPDYGEMPLMCALGLSAMPFPSNDNGAAQGVLLKVPGMNGCIIGARDTRTATIYGNLKPGDVCLHSTGPQMAAQVLCKEEKRQVVAVTKGPDGKSLVVMLDGDTGKYQVLASGACIEIDPAGDISLTNKGGASLMLQGDTIYLVGKIMLGGTNPLPGFIMTSPIPAVLATAPGSPLPMQPAMGVSLGT